ncbi:hypothetical protein MGMO_17c00110 [Methyloglobulus morosus KoM1]|uniref:Uncharacterized protein n=1 Tax=Methyloglobulus morosus KoM1 TaxID=1116472 RepID=V5E1X2_9GAMM|nr:hypothetical protein MGMO_17c00110 [Methyloglobulus morosus KoM1]
MCSAIRELKVVIHARTSNHYTIKPLMVFKAPQYAKLQALTVHGGGLSQIANRPGDPEMVLHSRLVLSVKG